MIRLLPLAGLVLALAASATAQESPVVNRLGDFPALLARGEVVPDTTEPWRYFPLEVGNTWEYLHSDGRYSRRYVEKDTLIGGRPFFVVNGQAFSSEGDPIGAPARAPFIRFDTLTSQVVRANIDGDAPHYFWECPFDLPFGATCGDDGLVRVRGGYDGALVFRRADGGADTVRTAVKALAHPVVEFRFAAGFGEVASYCYECGSGYGLRAARLGGWEGEVYGELLFPPERGASAEGAPAGEGRAAVEAWPNPFRDRLTLRFTLAEAGQVSVEVVDVLGRVAARYDLGARPAGEHAEAVNPGALPPGAYVVRLRHGGAAVTSRLLTRVP